MNEPLASVLTGLVGCLFGMLFFGGLGWTVRKGLSSKRPALWFLGSMLVRTGLVLAGFYWISGGRWQRLLACLFGFIIARFIVTRRARSRFFAQNSARQGQCSPLAGPPSDASIARAREASHAS